MKFTHFIRIRLFVVLAAIFSGTDSTQGQVIYTIAGNDTPAYGGDGGLAIHANLNAPVSVVVKNGIQYISDKANARIRRVNAAGVIRTIAGTGVSGFSGDGGPALTAKFDQMGGLTLDAAGNIYVADQANHRIRKINTAGTVTTIAGTGASGSAGDGGPATNAQLNLPEDVAVDAAGNIYIADYGNAKIRKINTSGIISCIAGSGSFSSTGDGGPATAAETVPYRITVDAAGNLYAAEYWYDKVRKINTAGIITTFAGTGATGFSGDGGSASSAKLNGPYGVAADRFGNIFINDQANHRIRKVTYTGNIYTICGTGTFGHTGDGGPATNARIGDPRNVSVDDSGNVYFADINLHNIRKITTGNRLPSFTSGASYNLSACMSSSSVPLGSALATRDTDIGQPLTWSLLGTAAHGALAGFPTTLPSTGTVVTPTTVFYTPATGYIGADTFSIRVSDSMNADTISVYVMVNAQPDAGTISGYSVLCVGATVPFTSSTAGGAWHASNTNITISGSNVTGMLIGISVITYTVTTPCGSDTAAFPVTITNTPYAGTITGDSVLCPTEVSHIIPTLPGGTWATCHPAISSVDIGGTVMGLTPGTDTVMYIVHSPCGEDTAYLSILVKSYKICRTGIENLPANNEREITITPNPNNGAFHISLREKGIFSLKIYNMIGQIVYEQASVQDGSNFNIHVPAGIYMITLQNERSYIRQRITKE